MAAQPCAGCIDGGKMGDSEQDRSGRDIVLCCDGTSNEPAGDATNVVRMFRCLEKSDRQLVFYEPGIGTAGVLNLWRRRADRMMALLAQATGYGLDEHAIAAYSFLCSHYRAGDRISLFGFSRGAYTARVVAGLIHQIGVLRPEQVNLAPYALKAYKQSSDDDDLAIGWRFAQAVGARQTSIHLLGLWDTVGSMIAPLKDRIGYGLAHLPYTRSNPSVAHVRHAMALDERRRMFRLSPWRPGAYRPNRFDTVHVQAQDVKQVWFAGAHGDVGGGHPEPESGLAKLPLLWMAGEARALGLSIESATLRRVGEGKVPEGAKTRYSEPRPDAELHPQPSGGWWVLEYFPKSASLREWEARSVWLGRYLPQAEPRPVPPGSTLHRSVLQRSGADYAPVNLTEPLESYVVEDTAPI